MNGGIIVTDSELLLKIREENKELWSILKDLAELYKTDSQKAEMVIEDVVARIGK